MSNYQFYFLLATTISVPLLAILAGILFNDRRFDKMDRHFEKIEADLREFYAMSKVHENRLDNLEHKP